MTNEQEIVWYVFGAYLNDLKAYSTKPDRPTFKRLEEVRDRAIKALEQTRWIPVSDPLNELPKDRVLYVTTELECVETLFYDMTEWSDVDIARSTVAYMDYYEPQPYRESEE